MTKSADFTFVPGTITGVVWQELKRFHDPRGWLCELFRQDMVPAEFFPTMGYVSLSHPGVSRGPHEHVDQADYFCFLGPGSFKVYLWDNRPTSPTFRHKQIEIVGEEKPMLIIIPPGVVHAYRNVSSVGGVVLNFPNRLYKGPGRKEPVDEIRHEDDPQTAYQLD